MKVDYSLFSATDVRFAFNKYMNINSLRLGIDSLKSGGNQFMTKILRNIMFFVFLDTGALFHCL